MRFGGVEAHGHSALGTIRCRLGAEQRRALFVFREQGYLAYDGLDLFLVGNQVVNADAGNQAAVLGKAS